MQDSFKRRKRLWIYIVACQKSQHFSEYFTKIDAHYGNDVLHELVDQAVDDTMRLDLLSTRNAVMLYKALKDERIREVGIVCNGFETIERDYLRYCRKQGQFIVVPRP